jgi:hypothetical protein
LKGARNDGFRRVVVLARKRIEGRQMKLVDDAKQAWKWLSVQAMICAGALQGAWVFIPDDMRASIPHGVVQGVTIALLVLGVGGRLVKQKTGDENA